ncbi:MAG: tetratricopeptide repeat protein [Candidatus Symbiothrix sp.]|jgi:tetratricopeptide (TPR) repeat protein|nr:tetratricopeptide repeat protein [Candidatus Symbiothrix sp.]
MKNKMKKYAILILAFVWIIPLEAQINTNRVLAIGKNALYFEDYILSIQYFNQVIKSKPYLAEPYFYRALAKFSLDDFKGAENDLTLCIERNPFLWQAYQYRGAARQSQGDFKGAVEDFDKGLEFRPENRQILISKSIAYILAKEYDPALSTLNLLLQYQPKYVQAYLVRGSVLAEQGDTLQALEDYNQAVELDQYYPTSYAQRGLLFLRQEKYADALKDFDEAIRLETRNIAYHINRGLVKYYLNDLRGAMADYDIVINLDAQNTIARFNRGLLRSTVGDVYGAVEDFNEVISQEPDNFIALYNRAILSVDANQYREAIADLDKVLAEYPYFLPGYYFRSDVKKELNDLKGADKDYWYAYDLEQKLQKERQQGKTVTGKEILDAKETKEDEDSKTREKSDKSIDKFNRLVVYDREEETKSKYDSEIRGRVQDKQVKIDLKSQFVITYYERIESIDNSASRFDKMISDYNNEHFLKMQLKTVNNESSLTDDQAGYHFRSIDDYSLILDRNPEDANAAFGRALDYMILQDLSEAIDDYSRVINLDPAFVMAYFNRAVVRYKQMEITDYKDENGSLTFNFQNNPLKNLSGKNSPYASPVTVATNKENADTKRIYDYDLIIRDYDMVIQLNPDFVYAYFNRGNIRFLQKDFRAAIADYDLAIQKNPDFAEAYFNRGLTRLSQGDTERGIADLSKAGELGMIDAYGIIKKMTADNGY